MKSISLLPFRTYGTENQHKFHRAANMQPTELKILSRVTRHASRFTHHLTIYL